VVLFSEFTSADGFLRSERVRQRLTFVPEEHPYFVQLFGNNPEAFREAALALEQQGVAGVDINMGCPAKKIVHSQHGSGLMRDVNQACRVVEAVANACRCEVSVKTRLGWSDAGNLIPFATSLVDAGASLITIHGRTYNQAFSGEADWEPIHELKRHLPVPVLGNGDVRDHADGLAR
ncbi:MAG: tRNA-dihydrouridine synthase family protein, partial [Gammaproteobacteria bacterium]|nr:tRNA-dihydrouridine synthase family protein [Gammaproteobacteria bacterium]NIR97380.1 tRNA-dihydrouridine synthase family protein [Gammaproteobacteria bacterium]